MTVISYVGEDSANRMAVVPKQNRVTEIATENGLPIVALVQSVRSSSLYSVKTWMSTLTD